jgi:hypothetical protein
VVRSPGVQAVALFGMCALAVAGVALALTSAAAFWPLGTPNGTLLHVRGFQGPFGIHLGPWRVHF